MFGIIHLYFGDNALDQDGMFGGIPQIYGDFGSFFERVHIHHPRVRDVDSGRVGPFLVLVYRNPGNPVGNVDSFYQYPEKRLVLQSLFPVLHQNSLFLETWVA